MRVYCEGGSWRIVALVHLAGPFLTGAAGG
jgi:hypothetical protein